MTRSRLQSAAGAALRATRRARLAPAATLILLSACMRGDEFAAVKMRIDRVEQQLGAVSLQMKTRVDTGGGDVNEPVTGWILAAGYAAVPASFLLYLLAHRWRKFRAFKERLRGAATNSPEESELIPLGTRTMRIPVNGNVPRVAKEAPAHERPSRASLNAPDEAASRKAAGTK